MHKPGQIRILALGLIKAGNSPTAYSQPGTALSSPSSETELLCERIFVSEGYDPVKQQTFYRAMGGGVDFGETSREALVREFQEEIQADLINIQYLGCLENLFVYNGEPGHELIQLYQCEFADPHFYQLKQLVFAEGKRQKTALWVDINRFKSGELLLLPHEFIKYL